MSYIYQLSVVMKAVTGMKSMIDCRMATQKNDLKRQLQVISCRNDQKMHYKYPISILASLILLINPEPLFGSEIL